MEDTPRVKRWTRLPRSRRVSVARNRLDRTLWVCKELEDGKTTKELRDDR